MGSLTALFFVRGKHTYYLLRTPGASFLQGPHAYLSTAIRKMLDPACRKRIRDCLDSLLCLESGVDRYVQRIHRLMLDRNVLASVAIVAIERVAGNIAELCGGLAERPVDCILEELEPNHCSANSTLLLHPCC